MTQQMLLPLTFKTHLTIQNFRRGASNTKALTWIQEWPHWSAPGLVIYGPSGCGKTHLAHVFQHQTGGIFLTPDVVDKTDVPILMTYKKPFILDDAARWFEEGPQTTHFFLHLYNLIKETGGSLLLLDAQPPALWPCALKDLSSRLHTLTTVPIDLPDDKLLADVLVKMFEDLQLHVDTAVITYLIQHMERSFSAAQSLVHALNTYSLQVKRQITLDLCRRFCSSL